MVPYTNLYVPQCLASDCHSWAAKNMDPGAFIPVGWFGIYNLKSYATCVLPSWFPSGLSVYYSGPCGSHLLTSQGLSLVWHWPLWCCQSLACLWGYQLHVETRTNSRSESHSTHRSWVSLWEVTCPFFPSQLPLWPVTMTLVTLLYTTMPNFICLQPNFWLSSSFCYRFLPLRKNNIILFSDHLCILYSHRWPSWLYGRPGPSSLTCVTWTHPSASEKHHGEDFNGAQWKMCMLGDGYPLRVIVESSRMDNLTGITPNAANLILFSLIFLNPVK